MDTKRGLEKALPLRLTVLPGGDADHLPEYRDKVIVVVEAALRGDFTDVHVRAGNQQVFRLFNAQVADVGGDADTIVLAGDFVERGFPDFKMLADAPRVNFFRVMRHDVLVNLGGQFLLSQNRHPLQAEVGGDRLQNVGGGLDVIGGNQGTFVAGVFQLV